VKRGKGGGRSVREIELARHWDFMAALELDLQTDKRGGVHVMMVVFLTLLILIQHNMFSDIYLPNFGKELLGRYFPDFLTGCGGTRFFSRMHGICI
jgi:hypothetical protein